MVRDNAENPATVGQEFRSFLGNPERPLQMHRLFPILLWVLKPDHFPDGGSRFDFG